MEINERKIAYEEENAVLQQECMYIEPQDHVTEYTSYIR